MSSSASVRIRPGSTCDLNKIYLSFANQALCDGLSMDESRALFKEMSLNTREYLDEYFELSKL